MVGLIEKSSIGYGIESPEGTLVAADANTMFYANEVNAGGLAPAVIERNHIDDTMGEQSPIPGVKEPTLGFWCPVRNNANTSTTVRTAPEIGELIKTVLGTEDLTDSGALTHSTTACATNEITFESAGGSGVTDEYAIGWLNDDSEMEVGWITAITGDTATIAPPFSAAPGTDDQIYAAAMYVPAETGHQSLSYDFYDADNWLHQYAGCKGNLSIAGAMGEVGKMTFDFKAMNVTSTDDSNGPGFTPVYDTATERVIKNARVYIDNTAYVVESIEFNCGMEVSKRPSQNADNGIAGHVVTNIKPTITLSGVENDTVTPFTDIAGETSHAIYIQWGDTLGYTFAMRMPKAYWTEPAIETGEGTRRWNISAKCIKTSGSDHFYVGYL